MRIFFERKVIGVARPRQPIDLIAAKGKKHLTKEEYAQRKSSEIVAPSDNILPPKFLSKKEKEKFKEIADVLVDIGIMTNLDCDVLARYLKALTEYEKLTKQLEKIKFEPDKKSIVDPEIQILEKTEQYRMFQKLQDKAFRQCNESAKELGLTISSRCKLVMPKKEENQPENKFLKFAK